MDIVSNPGAAFDGRAEQLRARGALPDPVRRQLASQATLDHWRGRPFSWRDGQHCVRLAHYHLRQMGHRPPTVPRVRSLLGARKALEAVGCADLDQLLDGVLQRIAPAQMQLGDLATLPGEGGLMALFICVGPRRLFGWSEQAEGAVVLEVQFSEICGAWRA